MRHGPSLRASLSIGRTLAAALALGGALGLCACRAQEPAAAASGRPADAQAFPKADRPVSALAGNGFSSEDFRDSNNEASRVMDLAGITGGMSVADLGAGEGYYTVRLSRRVGPKGRVLAENITPAVSEELGNRVQRDRLGNVSIVLGTPDDPRLPAASFDRIFMIHMYHEVAQPYEFLWRLRPSLKPDGLVVVVDADRPTGAHGTPPALLRCEFAAVGYEQVASADMPSAGGYLATFRAAGPRPDPGRITACKA